MEPLPPHVVWAESDPVTLDDLRTRLDDAPGADVVVVAAGREPAAEIVRTLAGAAHADSVCASVSHGEGSAPTRFPPPAVPAPEWGLVYVRRDALELALGNAQAAGDAPGAAPLRETLGSLLALPGLVHRRLGAGRPAAAAPSSTLAVTLDMRHLEGALTGTQVQALGLLDALARTGEARLTALAPPRLHESVAALVEPLREHVAFAAPADAQYADVFHRPHQAVTLHDLVEGLALGRRFVLTHQDMIAERTPAYFASAADCEAFRRTTRAALASADHVGFFSEHAALDAASEGVLEPERATVVPLGVDHIRPDGPAAAPAQLAALRGRPFLLVFGTAFRHKNRLFALRVLRELVVERGWDGGLVLAGLDAPAGSSVPDEQRLLARDPALRERVVVVGHVSESERRALYRDAAVTLFPSLYEGFGLIPFESAAHGTPCLYAWRGSLPEFLPHAGALPSDFAVADTAATILALLGDPALADGLVAQIREHAAALTWERTARGYLDVYRRAVEQPARPVDRGVLAAASDSVPLSPHERALIQVYRRRRGFRAAVDALVRAGAVATRTARRGRA